MGCSRGRASPDQYTRLRLFADSAGHCQNPDCLRALFIDGATERLHIAEVAHIVAAEDQGPRARPDLAVERRGDYSNLILLCPSCHTIIDKAPMDYPDGVVLHWKARHREKVAAIFGVREYADRRRARDVLSPILAENRAIFEAYGPDQDYRFNPESELADVWKRKLLAIILPNNRKILAILDVNRRLLTTSEQTALESFRQHIDDLEQRHLEGSVAAIGSRFPAAMNDILEGG